MRLVQTRFLSDGRNFNFGQPATLIEIDSPSDYDALLENIIKTGYYDSAYFRDHSGYEDGKVVPNFWFIAEMARALNPRRVFEVGCGRGDALELLLRSGVEVAGADLSADAQREAWPAVRPRIQVGDLETVCRAQSAGEKYDLLMGFDIWEHLLPSRLDASISAALSLLSDEGFGFFILPAFGRDDVFGEPFPLEFDETREAFERPSPFGTSSPSGPTRPSRPPVTSSGPIPAGGSVASASTGWSAPSTSSGSSIASSTPSSPTPTGASTCSAATPPPRRTARRSCAASTPGHGWHAAWRGSPGPPRSLARFAAGSPATSRVSGPRLGRRRPTAAPSDSCSTSKAPDRLLDSGAALGESAPGRLSVVDRVVSRSTAGGVPM
jgi:SAM-dependent methyltransferase